MEFFYSRRSKFYSSYSDKAQHIISVNIINMSLYHALTVSDRFTKTKLKLNLTGREVTTSTKRAVLTAISY